MPRRMRRMQCGQPDLANTILPSNFPTGRLQFFPTYRRDIVSGIGFSRKAGREIKYFPLCFEATFSIEEYVSKITEPHFYNRARINACVRRAWGVSCSEGAETRVTRMHTLGPLQFSNKLPFHIRVVRRSTFVPKIDRSCLKFFSAQLFHNQALRQSSGVFCC